MATKKPGDVPVPEPKEPAKEPGDAPDSTPEPAPEPSDIPERFQGKELGEVIEMFEKAEKDRDRSGTEVGNLRKDIDDSRNTASYYQNMAQDLQTKLEKGGKPEGQPDIQFNYDNPLPSIEQVVERAIKKDRETRDKAEGEREYQRASMNFATGRSEAMKSNPELYKGIEKRLEEGMWAYYKARKITAEELARPRTWADGARMIHMANENYDRIVPSKVTPVSSTPTEKPDSAKKDLPDDEVHVELSDFGKELVSHRPKDMSEKDFMKLVAETKKREGR